MPCTTSATTFGSLWLPAEFDFDEDHSYFIIAMKKKPESRMGIGPQGLVEE